MQTKFNCIDDNDIETIVYNIIIQAVDDFRWADKVILKRGKDERYYQQAVSIKLEVVDFFNGVWCNNLLSMISYKLKGSDILKALEEEEVELYGRKIECRLE